MPERLLRVMLVVWFALWAGLGPGAVVCEAVDGHRAVELAHAGSCGDDEPTERHDDGWRGEADCEDAPLAVQAALVQQASSPLFLLPLVSIGPSFHLQAEGAPIAVRLRLGAAESPPADPVRPGGVILHI